MGSELLISLLEIDHDKEPDWTNAQAHLVNMTDEDCADTILSAAQADDLEDVFPDEKTESARLHACRRRIEAALKSVKEGWEGHVRNMTKMRAHKTTLLIAGGESWGDSIEECDDMAYFDDSGCATAAGFLS